MRPVGRRERSAGRGGGGTSPSRVGTRASPGCARAAGGGRRAAARRPCSTTLPGGDGRVRRRGAAARQVPARAGRRGGRLVVLTLAVGRPGDGLPDPPRSGISGEGRK